MMDEKIIEGWWKPTGSRKWHYFKEGTALCGNWGLFGNEILETGNDDSSDNCEGCRKKLKSIQAKV